MTKRSCTFFALLLAIISLSPNVLAQQWSPQQQEVWQTVEKCWEDWIASNESAAKECFHEDYSYWWSEAVLPFGKDMVHTYWSRLRAGDKTIAYDLQPAKILVRGDVALVHWGVRGFTKDSEGNADVWTERSSMMMVKENGKWMYFGGGGSPLK